VEILSDEEQQLARLRDPLFNPEHQVILNSMPDEVRGVPPAPASAQAAVEWIATSPNHIELRVTTESPGVLVVSQVFYPGWRAMVDGIPVSVVPVDYALTGLVLKNGVQSVILEYWPTSLKVGLSLTAFSLLILVVLVIRR
jgi:uncharacterized membrane protein YfhO